MSNFFSKPAFGSRGLVSGFRDISDVHASTFHNNMGNHLTFQGYGKYHDRSLETGLRLDGFNQMGGLERRVSFLDALNNSPFR